MTRFHASKVYFWICKIIGFGLLFLRWLEGGDNIAGFFLLLLLVVMTIFRWRFPKWWATIWIDSALMLLFAEYLALAFILLSELFYRTWEDERRRGMHLRDTEASKYYEMESLQDELSEALAQIERMTLVSERTRIARDIHDNAGHEIVAAYMSFQTLRAILETEDREVLELYDAALERLDNGANRIREAVHNLSAVTALGVERLEEICSKFPEPEVKFSVYGDSGKIPTYVWSILESCLNESLTNVTRHAKANFVSVDLDVTAQIVRLCVENDGVTKKKTPMGSGLRNLRHRAASVGGNLSVDLDETFRLICVIPIKEGR